MPDLDSEQRRAGQLDEKIDFATFLVSPVVDSSARPGPDSKEPLRMGIAAEPVAMNGVSEQWSAITRTL